MVINYSAAGNIISESAVIKEVLRIEFNRYKYIMTIVSSGAEVTSEGDLNQYSVGDEVLVSDNHNREGPDFPTYFILRQLL